MVQGGYYFKGFAKHGPLHNPHAYGYFGPIAYQGTKQGGHVTPGGIIYKGDAFPPSFPRRVHRRQPALERRLLARARAGRLDLRRPARRHLDRCPRPLVPADRPPRRARRRRLRRRLVRQAGRPSRPARHLGSHQRPDLPRRLRRHGARSRRSTCRSAPTAELVALRTSTNDWFPSEARRILAERRDPSVVPDAEAAADRRPRRDRRPPRPLGPYVSGGLDDGTALELLEHPVAGVQALDDPPAGRRPSDELATCGPSSSTWPRPSPTRMVRSQLASSCQRWDAERRAADPRPAGAARRGPPGHAHPEPALVGLRAAVAERPRRGRRPSVHGRDASEPPLVRDAILERGARALASEGSDERLRGAVPGCWRPRQRTRIGRGRSSRDGEGARGPEARAGRPRRWPSRSTRLWAAAQPRRARS